MKLGVRVLISIHRCQALIENRNASDIQQTVKAVVAGMGAVLNL